MQNYKYILRNSLNFCKIVMNPAGFGVTILKNIRFDPPEI